MPDVLRADMCYDYNMTRIVIAGGRLEERSALRVLAQDLQMDVVGEAADWRTTLAEVALVQPDVLVVEWDLCLEGGVSALARLRASCSEELAIVLVSGFSAHEQAALSAGADEFVSRSETADRVAIRLRKAAAKVRS